MGGLFQKKSRRFEVLPAAAKIAAGPIKFVLLYYNIL